MSEKRNSNLGKTVIFSIFLFGSVLMVITIITLDLVGVTTDVNGYIRSTPSCEETSSEVNTRNYDGGQRQGGGRGEGEDHNEVLESPTPTIDFSTYDIEIEDDF